MKIAFMSDVHQNETYETVIQEIDEDAGLLIVCGDWNQCHKNRRPSKGKIKGLPGVDNGFGEEVQKWALEAAAYINHGTPIPKGETVDFRDVPSGVLRTETENYEVMHDFIQELVNDSKERLERISEAMYKKNRQTGLEMVLFHGHEAAYDFFIENMFDLPQLNEAILKTYDNFYYESLHRFFVGLDDATYFKHFYNFSMIIDNDDITTAFGVIPLFPLPEAGEALRDFIGQKKPPFLNPQYSGDKDFYDSCEQGVKTDYQAIFGKVPFLVVASHEGPKEISDIVLGTIGEEGKATENRSIYEAMFSEPNNTDTKVIWVYGNDGIPLPVTKEIEYGSGRQKVTVHHLAELDEKGNPMSRKGGVSYVDTETGEITAPHGGR